MTGPNAFPLPWPYLPGTGAIEPAEFQERTQQNFDALAIDTGTPRAYNRLRLTDSVKYTDTAKDADGLATQSFSAYLSADQGPATGARKVQIDTEVWDLSGVYDNATNYRYTPTVKGIYRISAAVKFDTNPGQASVSVYRNGTELKRLADLSTASDTVLGGSCLVTLNSDYIEIYAATSNNVLLKGGAALTWVQAEFVGRQS